MEIGVYKFWGDVPSHGHIIEVSEDGLSWKNVSNNFRIPAVSKGIITKHPIESILASLNMDFDCIITKAQLIVKKYIKSESANYISVFKEFEKTIGSIHRYFTATFPCVIPNRKITPVYRVLVEQIVYELICKYRNDENISNEKLDEDIKNYLYIAVHATYNGEDQYEDDNVYIERYRIQICKCISSSEEPVDPLQQIKDHLVILKSMLMIYPKITEKREDMIDEALNTYYSRAGEEIESRLRKIKPITISDKVNSELVTLAQTTFEKNPTKDDMDILHMLSENALDTNKIITSSAYIVEAFEDVLFLYFRLIIENKANVYVRLCQKCNNFFIADRRNKKYCDICRENNSGARNKNRKINSIDTFRNKVDKVNKMFSAICDVLIDLGDINIDKEFKQKYDEWEIWKKENKEITNSKADISKVNLLKYEKELDDYYRYAFCKKVKYIYSQKKDNLDHIKKIDSVFNSTDYVGVCEFVKPLSQKWDKLKEDKILDAEHISDEVWIFYIKALWLEKHCKKRKTQ